MSFRRMCMVLGRTQIRGEYNHAQSNMALHADDHDVNSRVTSRISRNSRDRVCVEWPQCVFTVGEYTLRPLNTYSVARISAASAEIIATEYVLSGRNVYSPTVLQTVNGVRRVWFGGWLNDGDRTDIIYMIDEAAPGAWTAPVVVLERPGQLVNDPTVLRHPIYPTWLFMYFTVLID